MRLAPSAALLCLVAAPLAAQQVADTAFHPSVAQPAWAAGAGPVVAIDEAHHNFHTQGGRYAPFADLLRRDGYAVRGSTEPFSGAALRGVGVLVVANALAERNRVRADGADWSVPTPSAFTAGEIAALRDWVRAGGSLLLIADHMPFGGNAAELAAAFGVRFTNGFARDTVRGEPLVFRRSDGSLRDSPVTRGRGPAERIDSVVTFTGQAFDGDATVGAEPLLVLGPDAELLLPDTAWVFGPATRREAAAGRWQGALLHYGRGRVALFGEAAMFTAQRAGPNGVPVGMNAPVAGQNAQFALNVLHWLTGLLERR